MTEPNLVFLSYARENRDIAERLYMSLREKEINVWLDSKCLKPGADWKFEINRAIRNARYYILLVSKHSVNKRGFVQKEIREALDVLSEFPRGQIFIIPVKIDDTTPIDDALLNLNWVDLYLDYYGGLEKIFRSLIDLIPEPLMTNTSNEMKVLNVNKKIIDKGEVIDYSQPIMVGEKRGAISYAPFKSIEEFFMQFIDRLPPQSIYADSSISYYFTISTKHPDLVLGVDLLKEYPETIKLVFQNAYWDLKAYSSFFSVTLSFNKEQRLLKIPYDSILHIEVPELGLLIGRNKPVNQ
ncbi:MAG TPA: ClpXP protease specificity-enhancing factor SspB [Bacteroidia bacterium]|nr:ClpXP protease specificity-enhancing factor SspB [Bacteroidia bacterium]